MDQHFVVLSMCLGVRRGGADQTTSFVGSFLVPINRHQAANLRIG
jgi:hypothetical protein